MATTYFVTHKLGRAAHSTADADAIVERVNSVAMSNGDSTSRQAVQAELNSIASADVQALYQIVVEACVEKITYNGHEFEIDAARNLMDDELCEQIHGTVDTEQEFFDAYVVAHKAKYGEDFVVN